MIFESLKEQHNYVVKQREAEEKAEVAARPSKKPTPAKEADKK